MISDINVIKARYFKWGYWIVDELIEAGDMCPYDFKMKSAYTPKGHYIGDARTAYRLCAKRGIAPELAKRSNKVCSIGYSEKDGKWYGWSHRAIYGFKVGSKCKKGNCHYSLRRGEWTAKTMKDAKQMAKDFC